MGYLSNPNSSFAQQSNYNTHKQQNTESYNMPGYSELNNLYNSAPRQGDSPDYMQQYQDAVDPLAFMKDSGMYGDGGGSGDYGPIGADELKDFGEGAYELFDKFTPGMEYIAENQGVSDAELSNMLGVSSSGYQANIANQNAQAERSMGRMGIDPTSGAYAAGAGERAMQGAAGMSGLQQGVRQDARNQDWSQRMDAAGIGLEMGGLGTNAMSQAAGAYGDAANNLSDMYGGYMDQMGNMAGLNEGARQYDTGYKASLAQGLTGARPALDQTFYGMYQPQSTWGNNAPPSNASAMTGATFGLGEYAGKQNSIG